MSFMFTPSQWADPTFLTFVKEYWEFNFKQKFPNVTVTVVFYIAPDNVEVKQDILVYFEVAGGQVTPRLLLGKKMEKVINAIFFAGNPDTWKKVAQTGSIEPLQGRVVIPDDTFKFAKGEIAKSFFAIGNRVADRMAQGAHPSISVTDSIRYDVPSPAPVGAPVAPVGVAGSFLSSQKSAFEKLEETVDLKFIIGGMEVGSRKQLIALTYEQKLKALRDFGPKKIDKFWKSVEDTVPPKEQHISETDPMKLPVVLFAVPNLRADLLAFQGKTADGKEDFKAVEQYLVNKLATASAALVAAKATEKPAESSPVPTEPTSVIEFPINIQGASMTCHIDFTEPVLVNPKDQIATAKCIVEKLDKVQNFQFLLSGTEVFNRQKMQEKYITEEMELLSKHGAKHLKKYWEHVETLPSRETFQPGKTPFGLIFQLMATPTLRSDLLALRGKYADPKDEYVEVLNFVTTQLKG